MRAGRLSTVGAVSVLALCFLIALAGCAPRRAVETAPGESATASEDGGGVSPGAEVLMLGRSVMGAWFSHWGYDGTNPVVKDGLRLRYREIEGPEGIARSASEAIAEAPAGSTVFFKFCFVDFTAGDDATAKAELERNEGYVETVVAAAERRGVKLVIGNALPNVASQTNRFLVGEHRAFNSWLESVAAAHPGSVRVFDEYSVLAGADGALKPRYASGSDDAHPNEQGYRALDEAFFAFMREDR